MNWTSVTGLTNFVTNERFMMCLYASVTVNGVHRELSRSYGAAFWSALQLHSSSRV
jgi:hypothetical protein